jgi:hypothetical protein
MAEQIIKRLVIGLGGKGGVGKTLFERLLVDYLATLNISYLAFDCDTENPELHQYYHEHANGVELLDFLEVKEAKRFFTLLREKSPDVAVLDMPGASGAKTREMIAKFGLFQIAKDLGYRVTIVSVLNLGNEPIISLATMKEFCGNQVDYVVVKNLCWDKGLGFQRWENGNTRKAILEELNGIEIEMPDLEISSFDLLRDKRIPFAKAIEEDGDLYTNLFGDYLLIKSFVELARLELNKAADYLGLKVATKKKAKAGAAANG